MHMMEIDQLITLANGGATVLLVTAVAALWRRLNTVTDNFTEYLKDSADRGDTAAQKALEK